MLDVYKVPQKTHELVVREMRDGKFMYYVQDIESGVTVLCDNNSEFGKLPLDEFNTVEPKAFVRAVNHGRYYLAPEAYYRIAEHYITRMCGYPSFATSDFFTWLYFHAHQETGKFVDAEAFPSTIELQTATSLFTTQTTFM